MKKAGILFALLLIIFPQFFLSTVSAQTKTPTPKSLLVPSIVPNNGLNLTLSPTYITLVTDPGRDVSSQFKVTNNNSSTEYLQVTVAKLQVGADGRPVLADMTSSDTYAKWLKLEEGQFQIGPNQSKTVRFSIQPTEDAALGYYYTLLVSRVKTGSEAQGPQAVIAGAAGITVLLEVRSPNAKRELQIQHFSTDKMFYEYLPTTFNVDVKNTGNVHVIPFGDIFVDSMLHKEIAVIHANAGRGNVLPQSTRTFSSVWDDAFAVNKAKIQNGVAIKDAKGKDIVETGYDFSKANKFRIGKYTAHLLMVYDNGERDIPVESTVTFWVIPWKILGGGFIVLLFALVGIKKHPLYLW